MHMNVKMKKIVKQLKLKEVEDHANRVTKKEDIKCTSVHNARQKVKASKGVDNMAAKDSCLGSKRKKQSRSFEDSLAVLKF
ncbi:hypothetical protein Tco_0614495 [Tanacetum coccineum]